MALISLVFNYKVLFKFIQGPLVKTLYIFDTIEWQSSTLIHLTYNSSPNSVSKVIFVNIFYINLLFHDEIKESHEFLFRLLEQLLSNQTCCPDMMFHWYEGTNTFGKFNSLWEMKRYHNHFLLYVVPYCFYRKLCTEKFECFSVQVK